MPGYDAEASHESTFLYQPQWSRVPATVPWSARERAAKWDQVGWPQQQLVGYLQLQSSLSVIFFFFLSFPLCAYVSFPHGFVDKYA